MRQKEAVAIPNSLNEAKQYEVREAGQADSDSKSGGPIFEEEAEEDDLESDDERSSAEIEQDEQDEDHLHEENERAGEAGHHHDDEHDEHHADEHEVQELVGSPQAIAEAEADAAHENALHVAALGDHVENDAFHESHDEHGDTHEHGEHGSERHQQEGSETAPLVDDGVILLPGETRTRVPGAPPEPLGAFPRQSARVGGGNPRSRFQRPFRSGGRDRDPAGGSAVPG